MIDFLTDEEVWKIQGIIKKIIRKCKRKGYEREDAAPLHKAVRDRI